MLLVAFATLQLAPGGGASPGTLQSASLPPGAEVWAFENVDGLVLLSARVRGASGRDTTGSFVLDTGAGYLALDYALAETLGLVDPLASGSGEREAVGLTNRALPRIQLGERQIDFVRPVLTIDADVIRNVTDRAVLGLLGQSLFANAALAIDYRLGTLAMIPLAPRSARSSGADASGRSRSDARRDVDASRDALGSVLAKDAVAVPFELVGDGKIVISATATDPDPPRRTQPLTLIVDTGATKTVLFEPALAGKSTRFQEWRSIRGLWAPTLFGAAQAYVARVPEFDVRAARGTVKRQGLDVAVIRSDLRELLSRTVQRPVDGLLGYSFLRHYRVVIDYPQRVLWLSPQPDHWDDRPYEYSHVGLQIERREGAAEVVAVVTPSPAADAGLRVGDAIIEIDGARSDSLDVVALARQLEGPAGTSVELLIRRGNDERRYRLERRQLL